MPETKITPNHPRRRWLPWTAGGVLLAAGVTGFLVQRDRESVAAAPVPQEVDGGKLQRSNDTAEIYQRAFWRRPRSEDKILHAERREWLSETDGVRKWEWFLAIEPGDGLTADIRQRFSLTPASLVPEKFAASPKWFRTALTKSDTMLSNPDGSLCLLLSPDKQSFLATGSGGGFAKGFAGP